MTVTGGDLGGCAPPSSEARPTSGKGIPGENFSFASGAHLSNAAASDRREEKGAFSLAASPATLQHASPVLPLLKADPTQALSSLALWKRRLPSELVEELKPFPPTPRTPTVLGALGDNEPSSASPGNERFSVDSAATPSERATCADPSKRQDATHNLCGDAENSADDEPGLKQALPRANICRAEAGTAEDARRDAPGGSHTATQKCIRGASEEGERSSSNVPGERGCEVSECRKKAHGSATSDAGAVTFAVEATPADSRRSGSQRGTPELRAQTDGGLRQPECGKVGTPGRGCGVPGTSRPADGDASGAALRMAILNIKDAQEDEPAGEEVWASIGKPISAALSCSLSSAILKSKKRRTAPRLPPIVRGFITHVFAAQVAQERRLLLGVFLDALPRLKAETHHQAHAPKRSSDMDFRDASGDSWRSEARTPDEALAGQKALEGEESLEGEETIEGEECGETGASSADGKDTILSSRLGQERGKAGHLALQLKQYLLSLVSYLQQRTEGGTLSVSSTSPNTPIARDSADPLGRLGSPALFEFHKKQLYEANIALLPREMCGLEDPQEAAKGGLLSTAEQSPPPSLVKSQSRPEPKRDEAAAADTGEKTAYEEQIPEAREEGQTVEEAQNKKRDKDGEEISTSGSAFRADLQTLRAEDEVLRGLPAGMVNYLLIFMDLLVLLCVDPRSLASAAAVQLRKIGKNGAEEETSKRDEGLHASSAPTLATSEAREGKEVEMEGGDDESAFGDKERVEGAASLTKTSRATQETPGSVSSNPSPDLEGKDTLVRAAQVVLSVAVEMATRGAVRSLEELRSVYFERTLPKDDSLLLLEHLHRDLSGRQFGEESRKEAESPSTSTRTRTPRHRDASTCAASSFSSSSSVGSWGPDASPRAAVGTDDQALARGEHPALSEETGGPHPAVDGDSSRQEKGVQGQGWRPESPSRGRTGDTQLKEAMDPDALLFFAPLYSSIPPSWQSDENISKNEGTKARSPTRRFTDCVGRRGSCPDDDQLSWQDGAAMRLSKQGSLDRRLGLWGDVQTLPGSEKSAWQTSFLEDASPSYSFPARKDTRRESGQVGGDGAFAQDGKLLRSRIGDFSSRPLHADDDAALLFGSVPVRRRTRVDPLDEELRDPNGPRCADDPMAKGREDPRENRCNITVSPGETRRRRPPLPNEGAFTAAGSEWPGANNWSQRDPLEIAGGRRLCSPPCASSCEGFEACSGYEDSAEGLETRLGTDARKDRLGYPGAGMNLSSARTGRFDDCKDEVSLSPALAEHRLANGRPGSLSPSSTTTAFPGPSGLRRTTGHVSARRGMGMSLSEELMQEAAGLKPALAGAGALRLGSNGDHTTPPGAGAPGASRKASLTPGSRRGHGGGAQALGGDGAAPRGLAKAAAEGAVEAEEMESGHDTRRPMRGVYFDKTQRSWIGSFYEDRRQIKKRFKIDTYGFHEARALAIGVRMTYERRMRNAENASLAGRAADMAGVARASPKTLSQPSEVRGSRAGASNGLVLEHEYAGSLCESTQPSANGLNRKRALSSGLPKREGENEDAPGDEGSVDASLGVGTERTEGGAHTEIDEDLGGKGEYNGCREYAEASSGAWSRQIRDFVSEDERLSAEASAHGSVHTRDGRDGGSEEAWKKAEREERGEAGAPESARDSQGAFPEERKRERKGEEDVEGLRPPCRRRMDEHVKKTASFSAEEGTVAARTRSDATPTACGTSEDRRRLFSKRETAQTLCADWGSPEEGRSQGSTGTAAPGCVARDVAKVEEPTDRIEGTLKSGSDCGDELTFPASSESHRDTRGEGGVAGGPLTSRLAGGGASTFAVGSEFREELLFATPTLGKGGLAGLDAHACISDEALQQRQLQQQQQLEEHLEQLAHLEEQARLLGGEDAALFSDLSRVSEPFPSTGSKSSRDEEAAGRKADARLYAAVSGTEAGALPGDKRKAEVADGGYRDGGEGAHAEFGSGGGASSAGLTTSNFGQDLPLGVFYTSKKHAYCANWYEGKRQMKRYFPISKLGEEQARQKAIAARREAEQRERETKRKLAAAAAAEAAAAAAASCGSGRSNGSRARQGTRAPSAHGMAGVASHPGNRIPHAALEEAAESGEPLGTWQGGGARGAPLRAQRMHEEKLRYLQQEEVSQLLDGKSNPELWDSRFLSNMRRLGLEADVARSQYDSRWRKDADEMFLTSGRSERHTADRETYGRLSNRPYSSFAEEALFRFGQNASDTRSIAANREPGPQLGDGDFGEFPLPGLESLSSENTYGARVHLNGDRECGTSEHMKSAADIAGQRFREERIDHALSSLLAGGDGLRGTGRS
ncbi:AP2 domain transcription factor AP2Ib-1 [Toxoplasma gondii CAST]|uniref:AP2 domain transcription factor AP2Ib-1 n=1 Tax=Toxoplasma gondii CAST TaxID=943122 RepID=A0A3R8AKP6_TOXGO|nr:AP2 domain transcription factor AP2Ib-1 [Toxoplasma gondii CAST]